MAAAARALGALLAALALAASASEPMGAGEGACGPPAPVDFVVIATTFFRSRAEVRFNTTLRTLDALAAHRIPAVVVDGSPDPAIREALRHAGGAEVRVYEQAGSAGKGPAIRQAARLAAALPGIGPDTWLCFQEPEKTDMVGRWAGALASAAASAGADVGVVAPARTEPRFGETYPHEQWHSESFGNAFLNAAAAEHGPPGLPALDWFFGPLAFRARHAAHWLDYGGEAWDAQLVPLVRAARAGVAVASAHVDFAASAEMKREEEGSAPFVRKRLVQLQALAPAVAAALEGASVSTLL